MSSGKRFPIQGGLTISWEAAEVAYQNYARFFGSSQSLERLAERGGFGLAEFSLLYRGDNPFLNRIDARTSNIIQEAIVRSDINVSFRRIDDDIENFKQWRDKVDQGHLLDTVDMALGWLSALGWSHEEVVDVIRKLVDGEHGSRRSG